MALALKDRQHDTYGDYLSWPDDVRYELIDGDAYLMSPAPDLPHQDVAGEIYRQAANMLIGMPCRAFIAPVDVRLPKQNEADDQIDTVVQPDVLVVCDSDKLDKRGVRGAPDWIVNGGLNAQKTEADIWRRMPPYFDQEKGGDLSHF